MNFENTLTWFEICLCLQERLKVIIVAHVLFSPLCPLKYLFVDFQINFDNYSNGIYPWWGL